MFVIQNDIDSLSNILQGCLNGANEEDLLYSKQIQNTHRHDIGECPKVKSKASIELPVINFQWLKKYTQYENDQRISFIMLV